MTNHKYLGTSSIALICQVTAVTVGNWIRSGKLKASRVPGGNYRVTAGELVRFLRSNGMIIPPELSSERPRVLIVSDEASARDRFSNILVERDGQLQIDTADNCLIAGTKLAQLKPDLVILRLPMAGMDPQACKQIRQTSAGARCKLLVILTTGKIDTAQHIGAEGCLSKDFSDDEFRKAALDLLPADSQITSQEK